MATFSVLFLTAPPPGASNDAGGAYTKVDGREVILRTVELFLNRDNIKQLQLCFLPDAAEEGRRKFGGHLSFSGVKVVTAGPRWIDQIATGAEKVSPDATHVVIHDVARPAVPFSDIDALLEAADKHPAVALAAACRAQLVEVDEGGNALAFSPSSRFMQMQTPQAFSRDIFLQMAKSKQEPHASQFAILKGSQLNVRIGGAIDGSYMRSMIHLLPKPKVKGPTSPFEEAQW
jgi:2-C-methyl-D-erythritol 4-phosphate cytidylyltransferase